MHTHTHVLLSLHLYRHLGLRPEEEALSDPLVCSWFDRENLV